MKESDEYVMRPGDLKETQRCDERNFKLEDLEMIKTIGTGTFARVFLCRPKAHLNRSNTDYYALKVSFHI